MQETADEAGLELNMELPSAATTTMGVSTVAGEQDELSARLAKLREADT